MTGRIDLAYYRCEHRLNRRVGRCAHLGREDCDPSHFDHLSFGRQGCRGLGRRIGTRHRERSSGGGAPANTLSAEEEFKANVQDIFFDYDKYDLRGDAQATISHDDTYLAAIQM